MQYIVLDMEWNQPWPGSPSARKALPIHGEIIQIGAVRVLEDQTVADEFQILIRSHFYKRLNKRISKLTGIKEEQLKSQGVPFDQAIAQFKEWCGEDCIFLTWGFDDIMILRENLNIHNLPSDWVLNWYNAQMMFNAQTDGTSNQRALKTAMEMLEIPATRPAHDALGDAYHTALICAKLNLSKGVSEYKKAVKQHENGFHGAELPGCVLRKVYSDCKDKQSALEAMSGVENLCPTCKQQMTTTKWIPQPGRRYMTMAQCPDHGKFLMRIRLQVQENDTMKVTKLLYEGDSEAAKAYEKASEKPASKPRRRHRRKPAEKPKEA